jgi:hypothetical protein
MLLESAVGVGEMPHANTGQVDFLYPSIALETEGPIADLLFCAVCVAHQVWMLQMICLTSSLVASRSTLNL